MTTMLTKREAADRLRVSVRTLDRLRSVGAIRTVKVGAAVRITEAEIERYVTKHTSRT
jgi:excisionase family DNA binding protein